jgi:very-short-patch-repair endonuclease
MPNNPHKERSRALRRNQTGAELKLWLAIRNRRLSAAKFRRQYPIGPYVADFACLEQRLVIEIDGGQHVVSVERDLQRSRYLRSRGFRVLRFWNNETLHNLEAVLCIIAAALTPALSQRERE